MGLVGPLHCSQAERLPSRREKRRESPGLGIQGLQGGQCSKASFECPLSRLVPRMLTVGAFVGAVLASGPPSFDEPLPRWDFCQKEDGQLMAWPSAPCTSPTPPPTPSPNAHKGKSPESGRPGLGPVGWILAPCAPVETMPSGQKEHPGISGLWERSSSPLHSPHISSERLPGTT